MPRRIRLCPAGHPCHIVQRGNNRQNCFFATDDYPLYLSYLSDACKRYNVQLHAYVLMTNHTHLLMTADDDWGISRVIQSVGRTYVQYINRRYGRTGTLWEGRFKSSAIDTEKYLFACYRYLELNPVRAGMVDHPADYVWSSYRVNAYGEASSFITPHGSYLDLGKHKEDRQRLYRKLFETEIPQDSAHQIRTAANFSIPLGPSSFQTLMERTAIGREAI